MADGVVEFQVAVALRNRADALAFERIKFKVRWACQSGRAAADAGLWIDQDLLPWAIDVAGARAIVEDMIRVGADVAVADGTDAPA